MCAFIFYKFFSSNFVKPKQHSEVDKNTQTVIWTLVHYEIAWLWANRCMCGNFVCVEVLRPSQPNGVMSSVVSLPNHTFTGQA